MRSSTSSSKQTLSSSQKVVRGGSAGRSIWAIVVGLVILGMTSEAVTILGVHRVSHILRRTLQDYQGAEKLPRYSAVGKPTMLLLGNSLLLEGVDYPAIKSGLADEYEVHRVAFEQTEYLDQLYVLRALFRGGARPHDLVLCDLVTHFIGDDTRGEFMSRYMDASDIDSLGRRRHLDATTLSGMILAHWSSWYAYRSETRKAVLGLLMPNMTALATRLGWFSAPHVTPDQVRLKGEPRVRELKELCDQYGTRLTILVPPSLGEQHAEVLAELGKEAGVRVLVPEAPGALGPSFFRDGFHLNAAGAAIFTAKLESELAAPAR